MKAKDVGELLREMGLFTGLGGVLGFELPLRSNDVNKRTGRKALYRVQCGGGIAGNNDKWSIVHIQSGYGSPMCSTRRQLKWALSLWMQSIGEIK